MIRAWAAKVAGSAIKAMFPRLAVADFIADFRHNGTTLI
jgi:hypothetical protein